MGVHVATSYYKPYAVTSFIDFIMLTFSTNLKYMQHQANPNVQLKTPAMFLQLPITWNRRRQVAVVIMAYNYCVPQLLRIVTEQPTQYRVSWRLNPRILFLA
ncbi:hypothetical protein PoB_004765200 [Plakobranchus ocellatus]|uniref:Uncharacterized protein n=1 Tax=Plakobranchus ocellatus TaxID=259542 RepID=A0AAV4BP72_9GAST|nr:hypothetical protein PoB_004765200 [Plakobranchus ocellatus]